VHDLEQLRTAITAYVTRDGETTKPFGLSPEARERIKKRLEQEMDQHRLSAQPPMLPTLGSCGTTSIDNQQSSQHCWRRAAHSKELSRFGATLIGAVWRE
jgi:hypothetical protein